MSTLENKTTIITGASRGIGAAAARRFADRGARVVLAARSAESIESLAQEIRNDGGTAIAVPCDVGDLRQVQGLVEQTVEKFGGLDVLVNNAGLIDPIARLADSDPAEWARIADINYKGVYYGMRFAIPAMLQGGGGVIINVSSGAAVSALEGWSHYCSSKAAVLMLTACAHKEYAEQGIRTLGISPGTVDTQMQVSIRDSGVNPVSQLSPDAHIPAEWVAKALEYLCSDDAAEYAGTDFSLKTPDGRKRAGLPPLS
ncbi:MAG: SDR family oxidoreductase [Pseudomonadota bacterium]